MKKIFLITAILLTASCTHLDQKVKFNISLQEPKSIIATDKNFEVVANDERKNPEIIGSKKFGEEKITISTDQSLAAFLRNELNDNLLKKGFKTGKDKTIQLIIKSFEYKAERGFVGKSEVNINLEVSIQNNLTGKKFTRHFEISEKNKHFIVPLESTDSNTINEILQEAVQNILDDDQFLASLME
jgi:uncharacterized lipoprotein YajG